MTTRRLAALGALAAAGYVAGLLLDLPWLRACAKPVPVLCLALWASRAAPDRYARVVALGLFLSALGDLAIEWSFLGGLVCFLCAHLAYSAAFWTEARALRPLRAAPFAAYGITAYAVLLPGLGALRAPVVVYMTAICAMMWRVAARLGASGRGGASEKAALAGAVLFAASDTLIALDRFHAPIAGVHLPIISLYFAGQLGIALSVCHARNSPREFRA